MSKNKLIEIDEVTVKDHHYLINEADHNCYYLMEYQSHAGYNFSEENDLVFNLKKKMDQKGTPAWKWKERAIRAIADRFRKGVIDETNISDITFVPMPPSKTKDHEHYDGRVNEILELACADKDADVRELLVCKKSVTASHESEHRPSIEELQENMKIDKTLVADVRKFICVIDDVLTTGAHYLAARNILQARFPDSTIIGIFMFRRTFPATEPDEDGWVTVR